jgi:pimeloyl-ACP methyl ester carboxylesterase
VRLDYSGHGQSAGRFEDGRLGAWIEEARAVLATALPANAAVIVIGSSMGAHVALKLALEPSAARLAIQKLVLIAPAWDAPKALMWDRFTPEIRKTIEQTGVYMRPSRYGDGPYAITRGFIDDGLRHLLPDGPLALPCPVHILHGAEDPDVPLVHGQLLASRLAPSGVTLEVIPDGDHRLSRPQDLVRLLAAIDPVA